MRSSDHLLKILFREGFMEKSELEFSVTKYVQHISIPTLTKFTVLSVSSFIPQNLYFHFIIISTQLKNIQFTSTILRS